MTILLYDLVGADEQRPFSPHCWKVKMALAHKGLPFRSVPTRFLDVPGVEGGISKTIPVIRDGDKVVADSFAIALYLDEAYPDQPTLFGGSGGQALSRFVERWSQLTIHPFLLKPSLTGLHAMQDAENAEYFRKSREMRIGMPLETFGANAQAGLPAFRASLEPLRNMLSFQPWIGGAAPLFADYIVFSPFQWARIATSFEPFAAGDPVAEWFGRCLTLYDGLGSGVPAAA